MHIIAAIIAVIAIAIFICAHLAVPRKWATVPLGLAFMVIAWMVQLILLTGSHLKVD